MRPFLMVLLIWMQGLQGCAAATTSADSSGPSGGDAQQAIQIPPASLAAARRLWARKLPGLITDLTVSKDGNALLVATVPDPDRPGVQRGFLATKFDGRGKVAWKYSPGAQIKSQAVSDDGKLVVLSTFDEEMVALDSRGHVKWRHPGVCKPVILNAPGRVLCYHDDDAEPRVAFDALDMQGRRLVSFPIQGDVLALKVSPDERSMAVALTGGEALLFGTTDFTPLWRRKVDGEIADLAVASSGAVAVLHGRSRHVTLFDRVGATLGEAKPGFAAEQVELGGGGTRVLVYAHGAKGQEIAAYEAAAQAGGDLKPKWRKRESGGADYPIPMLSADDLAIVGFERAAERKSAIAERSLVVGLDLEGNTLWGVPLAVDEGAVLYAQSFSSKRSLLGVGTDDSKVTAYRVARAGQPSLRP